MDFAADHPAMDRAGHLKAVNQGTHWLAEVDGEAAGFCCAYRLGDMLYIAELAVAAGLQGRGIGRALMDAAIGHARVHFPAACLVTDRRLPWNAPFYATLGFAEWTDPDPAIGVIMEAEHAAGFDPEARCAMILRFG